MPEKMKARRKQMEGLNWSLWTDAALAEQIGCSKSTIANWRKKLKGIE